MIKVATNLTKEEQYWRVRFTVNWWDCFPSGREATSRNLGRPASKGRAGPKKPETAWERDLPSGGLRVRERRGDISRKVRKWKRRPSNKPFSTRLTHQQRNALPGGGEGITNPGIQPRDNLRKKKDLKKLTRTTFGKPIASLNPVGRSMSF